MNKIVCMGELLIDFQSKGEGALKDTEVFVKKAGGAPANVCVQAAKLGVPAVYLTQVGSDGFGEFLIDSLRAEGVDVSHIKRSADHDTSLAFVSFKPGGEREFSFYRRTAADLFFGPEDFADVELERGDVFEFGSVALATDCSRAAHNALIDRARAAGATVCFDPNVRLNLWKDAQELKRIICEYAQKADVIKLGEDELEFVYGSATEKAAKGLLEHAKVVCVTRGGSGAVVYSRGKAVDHPGYRVPAVDTTGAGDSFFGGFIAELVQKGITADKLADADYKGILDTACRCGAHTVTGYGAIAAMGTRKQIQKIGGEHGNC